MINIAKKAKEQGINECTLGFSTGKDSIVGLDLLQKAGIKVIPIYFYIIPELEFIENNIAMYEKHFGLKIYQMPHPILYDYIRHQDWQDYIRALDIVATYAPPTFEFREMAEVKLMDLGIEREVYDANCMKMSDSLNRRLHLRKLPDIDQESKTIYLTKYHTDKDIYEHIKSNNIPMTKDYDIFGRSWDGVSYHFLIGVKRYYPRDYERIKEYLPLIDAEVHRYEFYLKHKQ